MENVSYNKEIIILMYMYVYAIHVYILFSKMQYIHIALGCSVDLVVKIVIQ